MGGAVQTYIVGGRIHVKAPYNDKFVVHAHRLEGRWKKRSGAWSFPQYNSVEVAEAIEDVYGPGSVHNGTRPQPEVSEKVRSYFGGQ